MKASREQPASYLKAAVLSGGYGGWHTAALLALGKQELGNADAQHL